MTISFWQQRTREADVTCDVAVVGGGVVGCATAFWLRRLRPSLRVAIVEAGRLAAGASGRNAGFLIQGTSHDYLLDIERYGPERARRLWHFTKDNRDLITSELRPRVFGFEASGSLTVAGDGAEDERLRQSVSAMRADGAPVAYIPPDAANRRIMAQGFGGGLYLSSGATVDSVALVRHIAAASEAQVLDHHAVVTLEERGGEVVLDTPVRRVRAGQVALALNAYLPRLVPALGRYVRPVRAQMLATAPMDTRWLQVPIYSHRGFFYVRQLNDGTILLGGARHRHERTETGYDDATTDALQADLEAYLHHHFPQTRGLDVCLRWSGTMGFSPDGLPTFGEVPGLPGSFWAAGFAGHGMSFGFRFGRLLAERILDHAHSDDADLFAVGRFAAAEGARLVSNA